MIQLAMVYRTLAAFLLVLGVVTSSAAADSKAAAAADRIAGLIAADQRPDAATTRQLVGAGAVLLDVRTEEEWQEGHIRGARLVPWQTLTASSSGLPADKSTPIVAYCRSGSRSQLAVQKLRGLGYTRAIAMTQGGFEELADAGMKVEK